MLDALPTIAIPATLATIRVMPGRRTETPTQLTQRALEVQVTIGGQNVADLAVGEATVGAAAVQCASVADLALECSNRRVVLIDVLQRRGRVELFGAAHRRFAGREVRIRFTATGETVATPEVGEDGLFRATARLPRRGLRGSNRARYQAAIQGQRSFRLKLERRMVVTSTRFADGRVTIRGRVLRPLARPVREVVVQRRLSCGRYEVVARFTPRSNGRFRVSLPGPEGTQAAAYRLRTRVRKNTRNRKLFPTFTLPRYIDLT